MSINTQRHFPLPLKGEFLGEERWRLTEPFIYLYRNHRVTVPKDFITDGGSIPWLAQLIIGGHWSGKYPKACVPHDYGYHSQKLKRKIVDKDFLIGMKILGVPFWKRQTMYRVVRACSWVCWIKHKRKLKKAQNSPIPLSEKNT